MKLFNKWCILLSSKKVEENTQPSIVTVTPSIKPVTDDMTALLNREILASLKNDKWEPDSYEVYHADHLRKSGTDTVIFLKRHRGINYEELTVSYCGIYLNDEVARLAYNVFDACTYKKKEEEKIREKERAIYCWRHGK